MREPLRAAIKKKRDKMKTIILSIRSTCADWNKVNSFCYLFENKTENFLCEFFTACVLEYSSTT